jgi:YihY family inner membrane protein
MSADDRDTVTEPPPADDTRAEATTKSGKVQRTHTEDASSSGRTELRGGEIQPLEVIRARFEDMVRDAEARASRSRHRHVRVPAFILRICAQVVRQWARDKCPQQAASLSYQTILSIVPLLGVALAFMRATGAFEAESTFVHLLSQNLIPVSPEEVANYLANLSENVTFETLGIVGLLVSTLLAFIMFNSLEKVFNSIWRAEHQRPLTQKFVVFYATATIGAFLVGTSLYQAARFGLTQGPAGLVISIVTTFLAAFLAIFFLPASRVRLGPAAIGATFCTVLFEGSKHAFNLYVSQFAFANYSGLYGALAVVPLLLVWVYVGWIILLLSAEAAYAAQNLHVLERLDRRAKMSMEGEIVRRVNGVVAARVMCAVSEAYMRGDKVLSRRALADRFDLSDDVVTRITERLKDADLLIEVEGQYSGFLPARPPQEIALADVLAVFRGDDVIVRSTRQGTRLDRVLREIEEEIEVRTRQLSLSELV